MPIIFDSGVLGDHPEDITEVPEHVEKLHVQVFITKQAHEQLREEELV